MKVLLYLSMWVGRASYATSLHCVWKTPYFCSLAFFRGYSGISSVLAAGACEISKQVSHVEEGYPSLRERIVLIRATMSSLLTSCNRIFNGNYGSGPPEHFCFPISIGQKPRFEVFVLETVCRNTPEGGLGTGNVVHRSIALLTKRLWRLEKEKRCRQESLNIYGSSANGWDTMEEFDPLHLVEGYFKNPSINQSVH